MAESLQRRGGPYSSDGATVGGIPTTIPDIPVCAVLIFIYLTFAATNMTIFQRNRRKGHKFVPSGMMFGFSIARTVTLVLRIAWSQRPTNIRLSIAAEIFVNAGILVIYILNLILAQRILRAKQPHIGWHPILRVGCKVIYALIGGALIMVITSIVVSFYTLNTHTRSQCRDVELAALTYLLVFTCLPVLHVAAAAVLPRSPYETKFGQGSSRSQMLIVTLSGCLCMVIAGFKAGANWSPPSLASNSPWYDSKACLYVFNFAFEIMILSLLTFSRIDKRFWIPNGSTKAGDYYQLGSKPAVEADINRAEVSSAIEHF